MSGRLVARYYDPRFGRFLQPDPLPDVVEQARARAVAAFTYEALAAAPAGWTSPEFEGREAKFAEIVSAGAIHNKIRKFDWVREEVNPRSSTGIATGNQATSAARKETVGPASSLFTGAAKASGTEPKGPAPSLAGDQPGSALSPGALNHYAYALNNPFRYWDPTGRVHEIRNAKGEVIEKMRDALFESFRSNTNQKGLIFADPEGEGRNIYLQNEDGTRGAFVGRWTQTSVDLPEQAQVVLGLAAEKCGGSGDAMALAIGQFYAAEVAGTVAGAGAGYLAVRGGRYIWKAAEASERAAPIAAKIEQASDWFWNTRFGRWITPAEPTYELGLEVPKPAVHKNSLEYVGETHVYRIKGPDEKTFKIGESAQGVRVSDQASKRAEQQARRLTRETGETFTTEIRKLFRDKASAREYETRLIERYRQMYGEGTLPGNKTNR